MLNAGHRAERSKKRNSSMVQKRSAGLHANGILPVFPETLHLFVAKDLLCPVALCAQIPVSGSEQCNLFAHVSFFFSASSFSCVSREAINRERVKDVDNDKPKDSSARPGLRIVCWLQVQRGTYLIWIEKSQTTASHLKFCMRGVERVTALSSSPRTPSRRK
ncbi:hypothetical protein LB507_010549 [Fusarium sp. FIESC RH6]|nr:hypothetical protein LB507_010549 [Fusarium sp. FIESC RH6]